ncbi:hypothetical protein MHB43_23760 [Paenibacillus sp. FSL H8-0317]|uniref:hypothetical protein n=1 Tax=Paenibacillus sp. FSL H8-0317 TaxID=2921385 RepID=UPI00324FC247
MKKVIFSVLAASTLLSSSVYATPQSEMINIKSSSTSSSKKESNKIKYAIYHLSDQQIKNAIALGKKGYDSLQAFTLKQNLPISNDKMKIWQPEVQLDTPYSFVALASFLASNKYENYTLKEAKYYANYYRTADRISFNLKAYGNNIDFADNINVVFKQGNKIYQPVEIRGADDVSRSLSWPDAPAYRANIFAYFDMKNVDFSKNAELIYLYAGKELSVTYKVDFSKIK